MTTLNVSNRTELYNALGAANGGDTIVLEGGAYGDVALTMQRGINLNFPSNVTIVSADADNPAVFTGLDLRDAANITFDGITFDYIFAEGDNIYNRPFSVSKSEDIIIRNSTFDGDLAQGISAVDDGFGYAIGLSVRDSSGVTIENNEFFEFHRGAVFAQSSDLQVSQNDVHSLRMDGFNFTEVTDVLIEDNFIHDFRVSAESDDHSDMIQFWTAGTDSPSMNVTVRGNHLDIGTSDATQSIFMRNEVVDRGQAGTEMFYQNFLIENNVVVNGHAHGIVVGAIDGLVLRSNSVLHADGRNVDGIDRNVEIPSIQLSEKSTNVTVHNNITSNLLGYQNQADWSVKNNAFVQDQNPDLPGYYADIFLTSSLETVEGVHHFQAVTGGMLDILQAGANVTHGPAQQEGLFAQFHVSTNANAATRTFDASASALDGQPLPEGTQYTWSFGDGTTLTGKQVSHAFADGGVYDITLGITLPDGTQDTATSMLGVAGTTVLSYDAAAGMAVFDAGAEAAMDIASLASATVSARGIELGGAGTVLGIERSYVTPLLSKEEFRISMALQADNTESFGEVVRLHNSFIINVKEDGELWLRAFTEDGTQIHLVTSDANLSDTNAHDIDVKLDQGRLEIWIDGALNSSTAMSGTLGAAGRHDLVFGNQFAKENFSGQLTAFEIAVNESHFDANVQSIAQEIAPVLDQHFAPLADPQEIVEETAPEAQPETIPDTISTTPEDVAPTRPEEEDTATQAGQDYTSDDIFHLSGQSVSSRIERAEVDHILGEDAFDISFTLTAAHTESYGEVMRLHQSFVVTVTDDGELYLRAFDEDASRIRLTTQGADLLDTEAHTVQITREEGVLSITIDGETLAQADMALPLADMGKHDLTFGNIWTAQNFEGTVASLKIGTSVEEADVDTVDPVTSVPDTEFYTDLEEAFTPSNTVLDGALAADAAYTPHALADAQMWAEQGLISEATLDRFETILANYQENYFE